MTALFLASKSATRVAMLAAAGLAFTTDPATIDERAVEAPAVARGASPAEVAVLLSEAKALDVSPRHPGAIVIGSDQTLALGPRRFSKPADRAAAREQLTALRGRTHHLSSGAALVRDGRVLWSGYQTVAMHMRDVSDTFLESYLDRMGSAVTSTVGGYQLEGLGAQLFQSVDGDTFTVLGLPLLPLLQALRDHGALAA
jgi:septum formation protein